jgi:hypothetical protein
MLRYGYHEFHEFHPGMYFCVYLKQVYATKSFRGMKWNGRMCCVVLSGYYVDKLFFLFFIYWSERRDWIALVSFICFHFYSAYRKKWHENHVNMSLNSWRCFFVNIEFKVSFNIFAVRKVHFFQKLYQNCIGEMFFYKFLKHVYAINSYDSI